MPQAGHHPKGPIHQTSSGTQLFLVSRAPGSSARRWPGRRRRSHLHVVADEGEQDFTVLLGALIMLAIAFALVWMPIINTFVGGLVSGFRLGSVRRAMRAAVPVALIVAGVGSSMLVQLLKIESSMVRFQGWGTALIAAIALGAPAGALVGSMLAGGLVRGDLAGTDATHGPQSHGPGRAHPTISLFGRRHGWRQ